MVTNNFALLKEREKIELLYLQGEKINLLEEEIRRLKIRLDKYTKKNSKNSNKPSSTDQSNNKTQSLRKKSGKKPFYYPQVLIIPNNFHPSVKSNKRFQPLHTTVGPGGGSLFLAK
jgi:hypothetical protein